MIRSMTGFGRSTANTLDKKITIDVRSLNGKTLDINLKMPQLYKEKEASIRKIAADQLKRGKVDLSINVTYLSDTLPVSLNQGLIKSYAKELKQIANECGVSDADLIPSILRLPNVLVNEEKLDESEWNCVQELLNAALQQLDHHREEEGTSLKLDLEKCASLILENLAEIEILAPNRLDKIKERIKKAKENYLKRIEIDENRFEQEMVYYIEKLDINEEVVRLRSHCNLFAKELTSTKIANGKKLGFIGQEMGREINTIGSKAQHHQIQALVVEMKEQLEKIKEQVLNIL